MTSWGCRTPLAWLALEGRGGLCCPTADGIFGGMIDPRNTRSVVEAVGQESLDAIGIAVRDTRADLHLYRSTLPALAARHSNRGILNWVHDQFFAHVRAQFESTVDETHVLDREPVRDIFVGPNFRFRFKKHSDQDMVTSYPTNAFLAFAAQDPPQLIQEVRLIGGYRWDQETREIGTAVLSARDGRSNVLWALELTESAGGEGRPVPHFTPQQSEAGMPSLPKIVESVDIETDTGSA